VLIYATSNRRHLMPEYMAENLEAKHRTTARSIPARRVEEKISLSERFGLWVSFYPFRQDDYLAIVAHWLASFGVPNARSSRPAATRCASRWSAARARAGWPGNSPGLGRPPRASRAPRESLSPGRRDARRGGPGRESARRLEVAVGVVVRPTAGC
jgi:hypothetical protein